MPSTGPSESQTGTASGAILRRQAFRYRLYPTPEQEAFFRQIAGCCRFVSNLALEQRRIFGRPGRNINYASQCKELAALKDAAPFLHDVPHHCLQQALRDRDRGFQRFFRGEGGYPKPRRRGENDSFRFPDPLQFRLEPDPAGDARYASLILPKLGKRQGDLGGIRLRLHRPVLGTVKTITIARDGAWWVASLATERAVAVPEHASPSAVGVDLGVVHPIACSNGTVPYPRRPSTPREERRLARLQRQASRKRRGSNNRRKALARVAALKARVRRRRQDLVHKATTMLAQNHGLILVEDLRVRAMTASARGSVEEPGSNVRQKAGLNRSLLDVGFAEIRRQLGYKTAWLGGRLLAVPAAYTSQTCSHCGRVDGASRVERGLFVCAGCGIVLHADVNAGCNILRRGLAMLGLSPAQVEEIMLERAGGLPVPACGGLGVTRPVKQEPVTARRGSPVIYGGK